MIRQIGTKLIPVAAIDVAQRRRQPSEEEVERMAKSIERDGLLTAIGVQISGDRFSLLYGATRLSAIQKLGWSEVSAVLYAGTTEELASAVIIENLERRHLDKHELEKLTKALVGLRTTEIESGARKELDDNLSHNSSQKPKTHPKTKAKGAKRGRPLTAEGEAKREAAAKTGKSVRSVQRIISEKPKQAPERAKTRSAVASGDEGMKRFDDYVLELKRKIGNFRPEHFVRTPIAANDLANLGKFFAELAILKKSGVVKSTAGFVTQGNDVDIAETATAMGAAHAANVAKDDDDLIAAVGRGEVYPTIQ